MASGANGGGGEEHTFGFNFPTRWGAAAAHDILAGPPSYPRLCTGALCDYALYFIMAGTACTPFARESRNTPSPS